LIVPHEKLVVAAAALVVVVVTLRAISKATPAPAVKPQDKFQFDYDFGVTGGW